MELVKKLTKPEQAKENKRLKVLEELQNGLGSILNSEPVVEGIRLAQRARKACYDPENRMGSFPDPVAGQLYRALNSVPANIVEGAARTTNESRLSFMLIARGSAYESQVHARILELTWLPDIIRLCFILDELIEHHVKKGEQDD
jgi:four helix bundle protein